MGANYVAIIVAAVVNMALGYAWFGPLFGNMWMQLQGVTMESITPDMKKGMGKKYAIAFVGSLVMAYALWCVIMYGAYYVKATGMTVALSVAFWAWLGFIAPVTLGSVLWEGKPWKLWFLMNGYYLISVLLMGVVMTWWMW